ncbi:hypothetical protein K491DRAFT_502566 [Lophiostoma macrostomum CBS 122681]|uniref:Uncharacterized protein n=1 Tax=Lophiostoma macrostomum CBS 122681 TaxID=1314788 RepID=A0A6A6T291_9PLEO|nr:hypothetical protein K491DRAFT_502566 [Lophiostoma macrostomum CBS 122681]
METWHLHLIILCCLASVPVYLIWLVFRTTVNALQRAYSFSYQLANMPGNPLLTVFCRDLAVRTAWILPYIVRCYLRHHTPFLTDVLKFCDYLYPLETTTGEQFLIGLLIHACIRSRLEARHGSQALVVILQSWENSSFFQKHGHIIHAGLKVGLYILLYVVQYLLPHEPRIGKPTMANLSLGILYGLASFVWFHSLFLFSLNDFYGTVQRYTRWQRRRFRPRSSMNQEETLKLPSHEEELEAEFVFEDGVQLL